MGQQFRRAVYLVTAIAPAAEDLQIRAKFKKKLAADAAWRANCRTGRDHRRTRKPPAPRCKSLCNRRALCAKPCTKRSTLNIAAGIDFAVHAQ